MDNSCITVSTFFPNTGTEADWNAAYYRLEDYFRALRLVNKVHQSQIILRLLEKAAELHAKDPAQDPTELAINVAQTEMERWFESILGPHDRLLVTGMIALLAVDAPKKWPMAFMSEDVPPEMMHEMRESDVRAGPDLQVSSMVPRPIDISPLLDPIHLTEALEKIRLGVAVWAMVVLTAISVSVFLIW